MQIRKTYSACADLIKKTLRYIEQTTVLRLVLVFTFFFGVFALIYLTVDPVASGDDHFFHIQFAKQMTQHGFFETFRNFTGLYFSKITNHQYFVYYNFLFYVALLPFTLITPLYLGIKVYAMVAAAFGFTVFYEIARRLNVRQAFIWVIAIFALTNSGTELRLLMTRAYVLAPLILLLQIYCQYKKKYWAVFILSFIYLYWHSLTFYFPLAVAPIYYIFERFYGQKGDWKNIIACYLGIIVATAGTYLIAPGFLLYVKDIVVGVYWETIIGKKFFIPEGGELYPVNIFQFIGSNLMIFWLFAVSICVEVFRYLQYRKKHEDYENADLRLNVVRSTLFFLSIGFFLGVIVLSLRFNDYFVFFVGLYLMLALTEIIKSFNLKSIAYGKPLAIGVFIVIGYLFLNNMITLQQTIAYSGVPANTMEGVGTWLKENTQPGDVIFNPTWNWFTQLYYYSPNNNYIAGLEPRFIYVYNEQLYWLWLNISNKGYACNMENCPEYDRAQYQNSLTPEGLIKWNKIDGDDIAHILLTDFHSHYVVSSPGFKTMNDVMDHNSHFKKVYGIGENKAYSVYEVIP